MRKLWGVGDFNNLIDMGCRRVSVTPPAVHIFRKCYTFSCLVPETVTCLFEIKLFLPYFWFWEYYLPSQRWLGNKLVIYCIIINQSPHVDAEAMYFVRRRFQYLVNPSFFNLGVYWLVFIYWYKPFWHYHINMFVLPVYSNISSW